MKTKYFYPIVFLFHFACNRSVVFKDVFIKNSYSISLADYFTPCSDLHKDASLQYQNTEKEIYAIVIDEKKITMQNYDLNYNIDKYFKNIASQPFLERIRDGVVSKPEQVIINGEKSLIADITGNIEENAVVYKLAVVETQNSFYQLLFWTKADYRTLYEQDILKMIKSFKELKIS